MADLPYHTEASVRVAASAESLFELLDDHARLASHMTRRTWMMAGSRMQLDMDPAAGRAVGSTIRLSGRVLGLPLRLEEVVTRRDPPSLKVWETTREPNLLVIGKYRMGFRIVPRPTESELTVFIDYALPIGGLSRIWGRLFGSAYAQWCTRRMAHEAQASLAPQKAVSSPSSSRV